EPDMRLGGEECEDAGMAARCGRRGGMLVRRGHLVNPGQLLCRDTLHRGKVCGILLVLRLVQGCRQGMIRRVIVRGCKRLMVECHQPLKKCTMVVLRCHQSAPAWGIARGPS